MNKEQPSSTDQIIFLKQILENLTERKRMFKAARHFYDGLYYRRIRNDFELKTSKLVKILFYIQTNQLWNWLLFLLSLILMCLTYYEPITQQDPTIITNSQRDVEIMILTILSLDVLIHGIHLRYEYKHINNTSLIKDVNCFIKGIIITLFIIDAIQFYLLYPTIQVVRFSRILRAVVIFCYNKEILTILISLIKSIKELLQIIIVLFFICSVFAFASLYLIGSMQGYEQYDEYASNFHEFKHAFVIFYALSNYDSYPDAILPSYYYNQSNIIIFLIFISINLLFAQPIPIAIIFQTFRKNRSRIEIQQIIHRKDSLLYCFICLDFLNEQKISKDTFKIFLDLIYKHHPFYQINQTSPKKVILYNQLNKSIDNFFNLYDIMESKQIYSIPYYRYHKNIEKLRKQISKKLHLKQLTKSRLFEVLMIFLILINSIYIVFGNHEQKLNYFLIMDIISFILYFIEIISRILSKGFYYFYLEDWNKFDLIMFILHFVSFYFYILVNNTPNYQDQKIVFKYLEIIRIARSIKVFKIFGLFNDYTLFAFIHRQFRDVFFKILLCVPNIIYLLPILFSIFYIYSVVGVISFNTRFQNYEVQKQSNYADFNSMTGSTLILFQILILCNWSSIIYSYSQMFNNYTYCCIYFLSFQIITVIVICSFIKGITWEIFTFVESELRKNETLILRQGKNHYKLHRMMVEKYNYNVIKKPTGEKTVNYRLFECFENYDRSIFQLIQSKKLKNNITLNATQIIQPEINIDQSDIPQSQTKLNPQKDIMGPQFYLKKMKSKNICNFSPKATESDCQFISFENHIDEQKTCLNQLYWKQQRDQRTHQDIFNLQSDMFLNNNKQSLKIMNRGIGSLLNQFQQKQKHIKNIDISDQIHINKDTIMKKAILKDLDVGQLEKFETNYFNNKYESFNSYHETNHIEIFKKESILMYSLRTLLKYENMDSKILFTQLQTIEQGLASLINKESFVKISFRDEFNQWFQIFQAGESIISRPSNMGIEGICGSSKLQLIQIQDIFGTKIKENDHYRKDDSFETQVLAMNQVKLLQDGISDSKIWTAESIIDAYVFQIEDDKDFSQIRLYDGNEVLELSYLIDKISLVFYIYHSERKHNDKMKSYESLKTSQMQQFSLGNEHEQELEIEDGLPHAYIIECIKDIGDILKQSRTLLKSHVAKIVSNNFAERRKQNTSSINENYNII